ncbi:MAG: hypothetical protein GJ680_13205 [Alteromonadaceae bacterium]|nr:hypothetical protein [Alteromonadaceae bacterium]
MTLEDEKPSLKKRMAEEILDSYKDPSVLEHLAETENEVKKQFQLPEEVWERLKNR